MAKLHKRIADQRTAVLHEVSDTLTERFDTIVIEEARRNDHLTAAQRSLVFDHAPQRAKPGI